MTLFTSYWLRNQDQYLNISFNKKEFYYILDMGWRKQTYTIPVFKKKYKIDVEINYL